MLQLFSEGLSPFFDVLSSKLPSSSSLWVSPLQLFTDHHYLNRFGWLLSSSSGSDSFTSWCPAASARFAVSFAVGGVVYFPTINEWQLARTCEARRSIWGTTESRSGCFVDERLPRLTFALPYCNLVTVGAWMGGTLSAGWGNWKYILQELLILLIARGAK